MFFVTRFKGVVDAARDGFGEGFDAGDDFVDFFRFAAEGREMEKKLVF